MTALQVYSPQHNNRLRYVLDYLLVYRCGLTYTLTDSRTDLTEKPVLNYSAEPIPSSLQLEYSLYLQTLVDIPQFQKNLEFTATTNFDVIASIFYLLARVEEYNNIDTDAHGRYQAKNSILYKQGLLDYPVIDSWVLAFKAQLQKVFQLSCKIDKFNTQSTIDVDHIYAYKHKPLGIKLGSLFRDLIKLKLDRVRDRLKTKDPYDRLEDILQWHKDSLIEPLFFILTAQRSAYDKSLPATHDKFIDKISMLSHEATIGIHPSYMSNLSPHILKKEKRDLEAIVGQVIQKSRQHYLKMSFPETYRRLIDAGITDDYTMGYAEQIGFRAGTSRPFLWYDLKTDKSTTLTVHPFSFMDVTMKQYLKLTPETALAKGLEMVAQIKATGGCCSFIWHNSSFYEAEGWADWEAVYRKLLAAMT